MGPVKALGICGLRFPFSRLGPGLVSAGACRTSTVLTVARGLVGAGLRSASGVESCLRVKFGGEGSYNFFLFLTFERFCIEVEIYILVVSLSYRGILCSRFILPFIL